MFKIRHFDWLAPVYEKLITGDLSQILVNLLDLQGNQLVLDAGGGTGRIAVGLIGEKRKIIVADSSLQMLTQARQKGGLLCSNCDVKNMPFDDNQFDRILIVDAFHHLPDQKSSIKELWRLLKPGGRLIIEEPNIIHFRVKIIALMEKMLLMRSKFLKSDNLIELINAHQPKEVMMYNQDHTYWIVATK